MCRWSPLELPRRPPLLLPPPYFSPSLLHVTVFLWGQKMAGIWASDSSRGGRWWGDDGEGRKRDGKDELGVIVFMNLLRCVWEMCRCKQKLSMWLLMCGVSQCLRRACLEMETFLWNFDGISVFREFKELSVFSRIYIFSLLFLQCPLVLFVFSFFCRFLIFLVSLLFENFVHYFVIIFYLSLFCFNK